MGVDFCKPTVLQHKNFQNIGEGQGVHAPYSILSAPLFRRPCSIAAPTCNMEKSILGYFYFIQKRCIIKKEYR